MSASPDRPAVFEERTVSWVVRLLTGLQQGAEAPLLDGVDYVLGQDETCDLVLWDESVAPRHLVLRAESGRVRVRALEQSLVLLDRLLEPDGAIELEIAATLHVGALVLALGPPDTDWSRLVPPDERSLAGPSHELDESPEPRPGPDTATPMATPMAPETIATPLDTEPLTSATVARSWRRPVRITALVAGSVPIVLLILLGVLFETRSTPEADLSTEATPAQSIERAHTLAQRAGLDGIEIRLGADGRLALRGYSATRVQRDALTAELRAAGMRVDNRLWPEDVLHEMLRETLERLGGRHLSYDYRGQGEVRVQGILRPGLTAERLARTLQDDIPGIRRVATELHPIAPLLQDLREALRAARLDLKLTLTSEEPPVTLSGRLNAREMEHWSAIRDRLAARYPELPPLVSDVMLDEPQAPPIMVAPPEAIAAVTPSTETPIRVVGVLIGSDTAAYAILESGERLRRGERIGGRYVIEEIRFDRVIARAGGQQHTFPVGVSHR